MSKIWIGSAALFACAVAAGVTVYLIDGRADSDRAAQSTQAIEWPNPELLAPASAATPPTVPQAAPVESLLGGLETRLAEQPDDPKGWALLAQSYAFMGNREAAETAVRRAVELGVDEQTLRDRVTLATRDPHPTDWVQQMIGVNRK